MEPLPLHISSATEVDIATSLNSQKFVEVVNACEATELLVRLVAGYLVPAPVSNVPMFTYLFIVSTFLKDANLTSLGCTASTC